MGSFIFVVGAARMCVLGDEPHHLPGSGFLGWLGRQVGYVSKAVKTDVGAASKTVFRDCRIEEKELPQDPNVKLRRTVIDEVIVKGMQSAECKVQNEEK